MFSPVIGYRAVKDGFGRRAFGCRTRIVERSLREIGHMKQARGHVFGKLNRGVRGLLNIRSSGGSDRVLCASAASREDGMPGRVPLS